MSKIEKLRNLHSFFIKRLKPRKKIILRLCKMKVYGALSYDYDTKVTYISINKSQVLYSQIDALNHEWAHFIQNNKNIKIKEEHSDYWGTRYAKMYRLYLEWEKENG